MTKGGTEIDFNVFAGAETGILKGANVNNKACTSKNFHNLSNLQKDFEITCMGFGETENEILLGLRNQTVKVYDVQFRSFSQSMDAQVITNCHSCSPPLWSWLVRPKLAIPTTHAFNLHYDLGLLRPRTTSNPRSLRTLLGDG